MASLRSMTKSRFRAAVSPLRRRFEAPEPGVALPLVDDIVAVERPSEPMHCLRPATIVAAAQGFVAAFAGDTLYAVKCNPDPRVLRAVWEGGVRHFDCASPAEVALVRQMFGDAAAIHYMHPVKNRAAIREAYRTLGVRDFALDSADELAKILAEARLGGSQRTALARRANDPAKDGVELGLFVRLALPKGNAVYDLSGKFGAEDDEAAALLHAARPHARTLGLAFHVGSQCLEPLAYARAIARAQAVIAASGVTVDVLDIGGGFPVSYPDVTPPALGAYMAEIDAAVERMGALAPKTLWAEPGRALVAGGVSVVVQVELRRGGALYVNDGIYGSLSDAGVPAFRFPARLLRASEAAPAGFSLFGPTCDSADRMKGPFMLPDDVREGDWIEIGQLGAYGAALRTAFNGFDRARLVEVRDAAMLETPGYTA
jgi:ornithine decarboxylase